MATDRKRHTLEYPRNMMPEDFLVFVELPVFTRGWKKLGLDDKALQALQVMIMAAPAAASVIQGTGGLRKVRFAPKAWGTGKSGAARVCYAYFPQSSKVVLVAAYSKQRKDDLTPAEREAIRRLLKDIHDEFEREG